MVSRMMGHGHACQWRRLAAEHQDDNLQRSWQEGVQHTVGPLHTIESVECHLDIVANAASLSYVLISATSAPKASSRQQF